MQCKVEFGYQLSICSGTKETTEYLDWCRRSKLLYDWRSVCHGIKHPCGTCDQILLPVGMLLSEICSLVSVGHPFWREDSSAIYSVITKWSESFRTRNHTLLSHLRFPQPGGQVSQIYIPQEQGGSVIPPGTGFPLCRLLRLVGRMEVF
jgi:hypothetical protein